MYELPPHPPESPDIKPNDHFPLPNLNNQRGEYRFGFNDEISDQTNACFENLDKSYYLEGINNWESLDGIYGA